MADETPTDEQAKTEEKDENVVTDPFGREIRYISDEERRANEAAKLGEEEAAKYVVQDATPSSGGVFPPSALESPSETEEAEEKPAEPTAPPA